MITRSSIENLKQQVDLYQVVADYVSLSRSAGAWKGLSPFSQEKTPSFYVYPDRGFFYCFSTSQGGDAIRFLELKENYTFIEAVEALADRFNFKLEYESKDGKQHHERSGSKSKRLRLMHEIATSFYRKAFCHEDEEAASVRDYWTRQRGFSMEDAERFQIGYAPADGVAFHEMLKKRGFTEQEMQDSGFFFQRGKSSSSGRMLGRFRGRLMVPIQDLTGNVIAFTARKLSTTPENDPAFEAKYVNSPKTDLFNKGNMLFGIHIARKAVSDETPFLMVEGQLDAIRCWKEGFEQTIATQGTAITEMQLSKLKNYAPRLIMCLDGDAAGVRAAVKVLPMALKVGLDLAFIRLEQGEDPDSFLNKHGIEAFKKLVENPQNSVDFLVQVFFSAENRDPGHLMKASQECFEIIRQSSSKILKNKMIEDLALATQLDARSMLQDFEDFQGKKVRRETLKPTEKQADPVHSQKLSTIESDLLRLAIQYPQVRKKMQEFDFSGFITEKNSEARLLDRICIELIENPGWEPGKEDEHLYENNDERNQVYRWLAEVTSDEDADALYEECLKRLQIRYFEHRRDEIDHQLNRGSRSMDTEEFGRLAAEKQDLLKRLSSLRK